MDVRACRTRRLPGAPPRGEPLSGALILTGAPGAGKSSVLDALCTLLEIDDARFGAIESEQFSRGNPWLTLAEWLPQLAAVLALQREAGRDTFLVAATTENAEELRAVAAALGTPRQLVVCLQVPPELAAERVAAREPDARDRTAVAREIRDALVDRGITVPPSPTPGGRVP